MREWAHIEGYEGFYMVSTDGEVLAIGRDFPVYTRGRILKQSHNKKGYCQVNFVVDGKNKTFPVHRLVAKAFIPNPENKREIDHIDGDPSNNHVWNLRWVTHKENMNNPITKQRLSEAHKKIWENRKVKSE